MLALALAVLLAGCAATPTSPATSLSVDAANPTLSCSLPSNCVSSTGSGGLPALRYRGTPADGLEALKATLASFPEARVVRDGASDIGTVFTTPAGFQDEVDFRIDPGSGRIDFRSQSRLGLFDFGKNRARMLEFATRFARQPAAMAANRG